MKNELIIASKAAQLHRGNMREARERLEALLQSLGLPELQRRFGLPAPELVAQ